ncbi:MAG: VWA domain-containing protein [Candidatus Thorarchaeota archaeon]|nr:VWA domain-containing protein [Candidatus Thorarchaeota archaeon]
MEWFRLASTKLDVAFVVDTTGSMKDDIKAVKDSLFEIVDRITTRTENLEIRFGVVSYRDHPPQDRTYVTRVFDFDAKVKRVHKLISDLNPSEGGDTPEAVADGLYDARTKLSWERDAYKVLLLVGDAPPHGRTYNTIGDDYFPEGCPKGHDAITEVQQMRTDFGSTVFVFVCGCNPLVEDSFRRIAASVDDGQYYSLLDAHELPEAILRILEGVSDLIESDRKVLTYYEANDGTFDMGDAASNLNLELRELKTSLSRLLELGRIARWPKGRPLSTSQKDLTVVLGEIPNNIVAGKAFNYTIRVKNPSSTVVGIRVIASIATPDGVSEVTNEHHDISPNADKKLELKLVAMTDAKGKASFKVEVFYGSRSVAAKIYNTRIY